MPLRIDLAALRPTLLATSVVVLAVVGGPGCGRLNPAFGDGVGDGDGATGSGASSSASDTDSSPSATSSSSAGPGSLGVTSQASASDSDPDTPTTDGETMDPDVGTPACGNGVIEGEETCDDGDEDDADGCTTLCKPPSCDDRLKSGMEDGVDCGGPDCVSCGSGGLCLINADCGLGQLCHPTRGTCEAPASCLDHQFLDEAAPTGSYAIDPLGDGGTLTVFCEMEANGGGWTRLRQDEFAGVSPNWSPSAVYPCSGYDLLGPLGSEDEAATQVDGLGIPHSELWLSVGFFMIDNWEPQEAALFWIDGGDVLSLGYEDGAPLGDQCGAATVDRYGTFWGFAPHDADTVQISVGSTLDESTADESLGLNVVDVFVR